MGTRFGEWARVALVACAVASWTSAEAADDTLSVCQRALIGLVRAAEDTTRVMGWRSILDRAIKRHIQATQSEFTREFAGAELPLGDGRLIVGRKLGRGLFGVVHDARLELDPGEAGADFPRLVDEGGKVRTDLVVKFPNPVADPELRETLRDGIREEATDNARVNDGFRRLGIAPIPGGEVLHTGGGEEPFLIKVKAPAEARDFASLAADGLTAEQWRRLREQVFDKASALHRQAGLSADIRAENLYWVESAKEWRVYELTTVRFNLPTFVRRGWGGYSHYIEGVLANERDRLRTAASGRPRD